jgi:diaminopimelate epimerase
MEFISRLDLPTAGQLIKNLCDRKFGIGSDGLILIENHPPYDFEMVYLNPDGTQSLCGNGSRCAVMFAKALNLIKTETTFLTIEGSLHAIIKDKNVHLKMPDVVSVNPTEENDLFINTGSPHYVRFVEDVQKVDVYETGKAIRNSKEFKPTGTNVNFVELENDNNIYVRTFERGVENETLSCGTGVTASALATGLDKKSGRINIKTLGGKLAVEFEQIDERKFKNIFLIGPAEKVFEGQIEV